MDEWNVGVLRCWGGCFWLDEEDKKKRRDHGTGMSPSIHASLSLSPTLPIYLSLFLPHSRFISLSFSHPSVDRLVTDYMEDEMKAHCTVWPWGVFLSLYMHINK